MPRRVVDGPTLLREACEMGEATFRQVAELEHAADDELEQPLASSPLQPFWLNESDSLLFFRVTKTACIFGLARGEGFIISRWGLGWLLVLRKLLSEAAECI
jgi:hypothetical protein